MSHQDTVPPKEQQEQQRTNAPETQIPDPEVVPRAKRRQFSAQYKLRILEEADRCTERGQIGELLRREGLYSSYLSKWREQRASGQLQGLGPKRRGRPAQAQAGAATELARLQRENKQLRAQLEQAEIIIDVQKKLSTLLGLTPAKNESSENE